MAAEYNDSADHLPEAVAEELDGLETELAALQASEQVFQPEDVARAGVVITLVPDGSLRVERGFVRAEDEAVPVEGNGEEGGVITPLPSPASAKTPALSGALLAELEAHRTAGLQAALASQPDLALRVMLHGLTTDAFYHRYGGTVAAFHALPPTSGISPGLADSPARQAMTEAEATWRTTLPQAHEALWDWLQRQSLPTLLGLLAVYVARVGGTL